MSGTTKIYDEQIMANLNVREDKYLNQGRHCKMLFISDVSTISGMELRVE